MASKHKRGWSDEGPHPQGLSDAWRDHPRLQRHLQKFVGSQNPSAVLARYQHHASSEAWDKAGLVRHAVHVASWVALLSSDAAELPHCVRLLAFFLKMRGRASVSPWLRGVLHLVALRLDDSLKLLANDSADRRVWIELKKSMPRRIWKELRSVCPKLHGTDSSTLCDRANSKPRKACNMHMSEPSHKANDSEVVQDICSPPIKPSVSNYASLKHVRAHQKMTIATKGALQGSELEAQVKIAIQVGLSAIKQQDAALMVEAIVQIVGVLSGPRRVSSREFAREEESTKAQFEVWNMDQMRLRKVLLRLLSIDGADGLDLSYIGNRKLLAVPLQQLRHLLGGVELSELASSEQWKALANICMTSEVLGNNSYIDSVTRALETPDSAEEGPHRHLWGESDCKRLRIAVAQSTKENGAMTAATWQTLSSAFGVSPKALREKYRNLTDPRYSLEGNSKPGAKKHKSGVLPAMAVRAMTELGGSATVSELLHCCRTDANIQRDFEAQLCKDLTRIPGMVRQMPVWEASLVFMMSRSSLFEDTGIKRKNRKVFQLVK